MNSRWLILKILDTIEFEGIFIHDGIERFTDDDELTKQDRGFIKKVVFGTTENRIYIDYVINQFSKVKVKKMKPAIRHIMRLSVYQLLFMENIPESAVCNEAVKLVKKRKMFKLSGFVNGVLRNIARSKGSIKLPSKEEGLSTYLSVRYSFDISLVEYLVDLFGEEKAEEFMITSNEEAPLTIRVNTKKTSKETLINELQKSGVTVEKGLWLKNAYHISGYDRLADMATFRDGYFNVQDESSMLVGEIAYSKEVKTVIDVCSAPGGKALDMANRLGDDAKVYAFDVSDYKIGLINENVDRLGYENMIVGVGDATELNDELIDLGDVVVVDVPCSGLGIIRKKPDIKWNITKDKISDLVDIQRSIMHNVKNYVKPGGSLIYSTCTVAKEENEANVQWFLENNNDFELIKISGAYADESGMVKLMPISNGPDGFFIAKLRKRQ